ncbi:MAG: hypothetical protein D6800_05430 [Candidatus Zixiibacteriota bacterium]|nr:MAG: hypothetical protein D6800_05430 [candidate division Zixibacteria bacterium]
MAYTTVTEIKEFMGITVSTDDALLNDLITRAQRHIEAYTHRVFEAAADSTRRFDAIENVTLNGRRLLLDEDLAVITSITNGDGTTVASTSYVTEPRNETPYWAITLKADADIVWTYNDTPEDAIAIVGRWAYSTTPPADIQDITIRLVAHLYQRRQGIGVRSERVPFYSVTYDAAAGSMPAEIREELDHYRKVRW